MSTQTPPYGDAARVETLAGVDNATALELLDTACWVIDSYVWPCVIPTDPVPMPVDTAATLLAVRLNGASATGQQVVSESIGSYSYRLASTPAADRMAADMPDDLARLLGPWSCRSNSTTLDTSTANGCESLPVDAWQRNLACGPDGKVVHT